MTLEWTPASDGDPTFEVTSARQHNTLAGRSAAGAHPATALSYDNTTSGLTADTVQEAIDEVAASGGAVDSVNGETGVVVLDASDVGAVPVTAVGLLAGERNRGDWDNATAYVVGDVVHDHDGDGQVYVATAPNTGDQPSLTPGSWDVLDPTGRHVHLGPGATTGDYGTAVGPVATSGGFGTAVGVGATAGDYGTAVGPAATAGDYEVNLANIYTGTLDPGNPTVPLTATIATGHVDLPETADVTNPAADHQRLIARTDGLYVRDETGAEVGPLGAGGGGGGIPETLIDAAGDLIVGTAADTAGRLAIGTTGQVLTSNGTTAAWATPPIASIGLPARVAGSYYGPTGNASASASHNITAAGVLHVFPQWHRDGTYTRIAVDSTVAAASTWRLGIYHCDENGDPRGQALLYDAGAVDMNNPAGVQYQAGTFVIPFTGRWGLAILCDAFTAAPTVYRYDNTGNSLAVIPAVAWMANLGLNGRGASFATRSTGVPVGALPATCPIGGSWVDNSPRIALYA